MTTKFSELLDSLEALEKAAKINRKGLFVMPRLELYGTGLYAEEQKAFVAYFNALRNAAPGLIAVARAACAVDNAGVATADPYEAKVLNALGDAIVGMEEKLC